MESMRLVYETLVYESPYETGLGTLLMSMRLDWSVRLEDLEILADLIDN